jgi:hypothetical protein
MKATLINRTYTTNTYRVEDYEGMTKEEMIDACDPNNFGGYVVGNIVTVYID